MRENLNMFTVSRELQYSLPGSGIIGERYVSNSTYDGVSNGMVTFLHKFATNSIEVFPGIRLLIKELVKRE